MGPGRDGPRFLPWKSLERRDRRGTSPHAGGNSARRNAGGLRAYSKIDLERLFSEDG